MRLACVMMQKNEKLLLEPWIRYHGDLVGSENLFIFDNGSSDHSVIEFLKGAEEIGVNVFWDHASRSDYLDKGSLVARLIQKLDRANPYDFYLLLDCDEFLACQTEAGPSCERQEVDAALLPLLGSKDVLVVASKYWNNPCRMHKYSRTIASRKCFFARDACGSLDHGYHHARARLSNKEIVTRLVYFEFHYQPYLLHRKASRQHLSGLLPDFSRRSLRAYAQKRSFCFHCAVDLLKGKYDFVRSFLQVDDLVEAPALLSSFDRLGIAYQALFEPQPPIPEGLYLFLLRVRQAVMWRLEDVIDAFRLSARWLRGLAGRMRRIFVQVAIRPNRRR
jgi:hypothetical protein